MHIQAATHTVLLMKYSRENTSVAFVENTNYFFDTQKPYIAFATAINNGVDGK